MKLIASDIDGVLTDGCVYLDAKGRETKKICYRDLDAVGAIRKSGYRFALITGEDSAMARILAVKFGAELAIYGAKDKLGALENLVIKVGVELSDIIYIGDSDRDAPALLAAGIGVAPCDASGKARAAADVITQAVGGSGVLHEVAELLERGELI